VTSISREIFVDLERDVAAFIALWLLIHDGDPPPEQVGPSAATAALAAAMVIQLRSEFTESAKPLSDEQLSARLARLGLQLQLPEKPAAAEAVRPVTGLVCIRGPEGAPGCCVRLPVLLSAAE
jgi:hypothetical protein